MKIVYLTALALLLSVGHSFSQCTTGNAQIQPSGFNNTDGGFFQYCLNDEVTFSASGSTVPAGDVVTEYNWSFGNGQSSTTSVNTASHTYINADLYGVVLEINTQLGCTFIDTVFIVVNVEPDFEIVDTVFTCIDDQTWIAANASSESLNNEPGYLNNTLTQIVDNETVTMDINVGNFAGQTLTSCDQLNLVMVNLEHSFMSDIQISLVCPSGQSVFLHNQGGGGTYLGEPVDNTNGTPGIGYSYYWDTEATTTLATYATTSGTPPSGNYLPAGNLCDLVGCDLNGTWSFIISDLVGADDGFAFSAAIGFTNSTFTVYNYTQTFGSGADSTYWQGSGILNSTPSMDSILVNTSAAGNYSFQYIAIGSGGCTYTATTVVVVSGGSPNTPIIIQSGLDLISTSGAYFQWYLNGMPIDGATAQQYTPVQTGSYVVQVFNTFGCSTFSEPFSFEYDLIGEYATHPFTAFPNPFDNSLNIDMNAMGSFDGARIQLTDVAGRVVMDVAAPNKKQTQSIQTYHFPSGIYFIRLMNDNRVIRSQKVIKL
jgi:subtilisin-like proprotein convertase family protein